MKVVRIRQKLVSSPLHDLAGVLQRQLDGLGLSVPQGAVAITAGSRGISRIADILTALGHWLRQRGADPFLAPCMGSHGGGTAKGQRDLLEALGLKPERTGLTIRSRMEAIRLGGSPYGPVFMDRECFESAGVFVVNRIKLHTAFSGPLQSGLMKMMVVGMGKIPGAETFHAIPPADMSDALRRMGQVALSSGKILAGVAILEDGYGQTAALHALRPEQIPEEEVALLERSRHYFPRLPVTELNVLIVGAIGKVYSGTGMDTNVIGYRGIRGHEDLQEPHIRVVAALDLAPDAQGNALGIGLADFITQRLRDRMDAQKTYRNALTSGYPRRAAIPVTFRDDRELVETLARRYGEHRWMFVPNTLHLDVLYATEDVAAELRSHSGCEVEPESMELPFVENRLALDYHPGADTRRSRLGF